MLKKTIDYVDFDGNKRSEDFYFNLTEAELTMMELSVAGGLRARLEKIVKTQDQPAIVATFKDIIKMSYGVKSDDGRKFVKSDAAYEDFASTQAYSELVMQLCTGGEEASKFVEGILPKRLQNNQNSMRAAVEAMK